MSLKAPSPGAITPKEYLSMERTAATKHEYYRGAVYAMAGASARHNVIVSNVIISIGSQFRGRSCTVYPSDMRVKVAATGLYTYPDVTVLCGRPKFEDRRQDTLLNPTLIVEVLSRTTAAYDRGAKFAHYRMLSPLTDYILIAQDEPLVEHFVRQPGDKWLLSAYNHLDAAMLVDSLSVTVPLADIYNQIDWPPEDGAVLRVIREDEVAYPVLDPR